MVGAFQEPSCGRRCEPIHSIPYSVAQPLERGFKNYYFIIQGYVDSLYNAEKYSKVAALDFSSKELLIAIPDMELSDAQINAFNSLYEYASQKGIAVTIAIIK